MIQITNLKYLSYVESIKNCIGLWDFIEPYVYGLYCEIYKTDYMKYVAIVLVIGYLIADYWVHNDMLKRKEKGQN